MTGFEPLLATGAAYLGGLMLEVLKDKGKAEGGNFFSRLLNRDIGKDVEQLIYDVAGKYVESYAKRHGTLKVLGMPEPVKLDDVFTTVQFLAEDEVKRFATAEDLEKTFRELGRGFRHWSKERRDGIAVAYEKQFLMVLGQPGAGKSTFLRKVGLEALKGKKGVLKLGKIPVLLELKRFTKSEIDLKALITSEFETCGFSKAKDFTEQALKQGKLLILLDGLDEVPTDNINPVIDAIQDFVDRYDKNRYIASCRTAAYRGNFRRFSDVIISDFSDEQIHQFINNWFRSKEDEQAGTASRCWELLQKPENQAAKELAHTPLLLTFLCLVYDESQTFSNNRSGLYQKALRVLLEKWAAEKRIQSKQIYEGLSVELEEVLLSEIAYTGFEADRLFMLKPQLVEQIRSFLSSNLNAPKHIGGEAVLDAIALQQGILVERTTNVYSFSHLTLQEYLTAKYICEHALFSQIADQHITDNRWREVLLLTSGLMVGKGADDLLKAMYEASKQQTQYPKVRALLQWADQVTAGSSGPFKPAAKRAVAIYIAIAIYMPISVYISIVRSIASTITSDITSDITIHFKFTDISTNVRTGLITITSDIVGAIGRLSTIAKDINIDITIATAIAIARAIDIGFANARTIDNDFFFVITNDFLFVITNAIKSCSNLKRLGIFTNIGTSDLAAKLKAFKSALESKDEDQILKTAKEVEPAYLKAFQLTKELITWNEAEATDLSTDLNNYLGNIDLLLKCKQEAARLSPTTWEAIEAELFLPPAD